MATRCPLHLWRGWELRSATPTACDQPQENCWTPRLGRLRCVCCHTSVPVNPRCPHLCSPTCSDSNFPEFKGRKKYKETVAFEQWNSANNRTAQLQGMTQCCQHCPGWGNRLQASTCHCNNVTHANTVIHLQRGGGPGPSAHHIP